MSELHWFTYNILNCHTFCFSLLFNSIVFGLYLPDSKGNQTKANTSWDIDTRSVGLNKNFLWSGRVVNGNWIVEVPYINKNLEPEVNARFLHMVDQFKKHSCIRWVKRTNEAQFVQAESIPRGNWPANRCQAVIGRGYGASFIYLSKRCLGLAPNQYQRTFNLAHEMFHSLNFIHEHQRKDRDCFINIQGRAKENDYQNYGIYQIQETDLTFPYDEESIMHYPDRNIQSKLNRQIGPKTDFPSKMDWIKVNHHYCGGKHYCEQQDRIATKRCQQHRKIQWQCLHSE